MDDLDDAVPREISDVFLDRRPSEVRPFFDCEHGPGQWHVQHASIREALSRPYRIDVSLLTESTDTDTDELVGRSCELTVQAQSYSRTFRGIVARVHHRGIVQRQGSTEFLAVDLEIVPALALLGQRVNCRIFQAMDVPAIVRDVLLDEASPPGELPGGLRAHHRTLDTDALTAANYEPPRDYCVQYKESDLDFFHRLLHEEGIVYTFGHDDGDGEVLRLFDEEGSLPEIEAEDGPQLEVNPHAAVGCECITNFTYQRTTTPTKVAVRHYDWLSPPEPVHHDGTTFTVGNLGDNEREVYVPLEQRMRERYVDDRIVGTHDESQRQLGLALERLMSDDFIGRGSSNVGRMTAGSIFEVDNPTDLRRMVVLEVVHEITGNGQDVDGVAHYENHFVCVPSFRFRCGSVAVPRPVMRGPQTATVTGPPGEEIHTDAYGRVKILLHWDRDGEGRGRARRHDAASSVWVPVVQPWAGPGWGFVFLPRIGMEVLVQFLDGNVDRPVVAGCLYNGANRPPYALPEERTKSTIKTNSSPTNGGYNELRFEDAASFEEIFLHAQRDYNEVVLRNHTTDVREDQSHTVGRDRTRRVGGDETVEVTGSRRVTISGQGGQGFSGESIRVSNDYQLDVARTIHVQAPVEIVLTCEGSTITMTPERITLQAGGGAKLVLDANGLLQSNDGSQALLDQNVDIRAEAGGEITLDGPARMASKDGAELLLNEHALLRSNGDGQAECRASVVSLTSGSADLTLDGNATSLQSDTIDMTADTRMTLEGADARANLSGSNVEMN